MNLARALSKRQRRTFGAAAGLSLGFGGMLVPGLVSGSPFVIAGGIILTGLGLGLLSFAYFAPSS